MVQSEWDFQYFFTDNFYGHNFIAFFGEQNKVKGTFNS